MNRFKPMRAQGDPGQKLGRHEVVQQTALGVGWPGHAEDVMASHSSNQATTSSSAIAGSHAAPARRSLLSFSLGERGEPRLRGRAGTAG